VRSWLRSFLMNEASEPTGPAAGSESHPTTVFISHSSADSDLADAIARRLHQAGLDVFSASSASGGIPVGADFREAIREAVSNADAVVILMSNAAQAGSWTSMEQASAIASAASTGAPRLLPVLAEPGVSLPPILADVRYADASRPELRDAALESLVRALTTP
jgi:TIR domain